MKNVPHAAAARVSLLLTAGFAAVLAITPALAQSAESESVRRLQEENAALRQQLAELTAKLAPTPTPAPNAPRTEAPPPAERPIPVESTSANPSVSGVSDDGTVLLSPFEVTSKKDFGYLRTNTATATRIGTEIQKVPLAITVLSSDFVQDTGMRDIQDVLRYVASASGDPRMGIRQPGNSATPSGAIMLRGFPISQRLRNGVFRYTAYSLDNIDRVEIIKGPASIFYGVGYPGGVINYVTKKPQFTKIPTTFSYSYGGEGENTGDQRMTLDHNVVLNDKTAFRIVGAWNNYKGDKNFEYNKGFSVTPSVTVRPFDNNKLIITAEAEHTEFERNQDDSSWIYNEQFFLDYKNPSASLLKAAGIDPTASNALAQWQGRMGPRGSLDGGWGRTYGTWVNYKRIELNNPYWAAYQTSARGAYYNDLQGNRVHDEQFNFYGRGAFTKQTADTLEVTVDMAPFSWLDARYVFTDDDADYEQLTNSYTPVSDGNTFFAAAPANSGYLRASENHQLDIVLKGEYFKIKNKLLFGGLFSRANQRYTGYGPYLFINIPGAAEYNPNLPDNGTTNIPPWLNNYNWGLAYQTLKDRSGTNLNAYEVFARYDPSLHPQPDVSRITRPDRSIVDAGKPTRKEVYINYLADLFKDRLHLMGGYRWTYNYSNGGQRASSNPPWYIGDGDMRYWDPSVWDAYGIGQNSGFNPWVRNANGSYQAPKPLPTADLMGSYYAGSFGSTAGTSWMMGASYDITKEISVYFSRSSSFRPTGGAGAIYDILAVRQRATEVGLNPDTELARVRATGDQQYGNETGLNTEVGVKTSLWDSKVVSTFSLFQLDRAGEVLDDSLRQLDDPLNWTGANKTGSYNRVVRWYGNGTKRRVEGAELEVIWTPVRNYQIVSSGSWLWKAKTLLDTSIAPTDAAKAYYTYAFRMPGVSEYRFNLFNKYTFTNATFRGLSLACGVRYASEMNISNDANWDSKNGGLTAGNYVVYDANISYPWKVGGYAITTTLNVTNLLDEDYVEGGGAFASNGYSFSPPRTWMLTTAFKF